MLDYENTFRHVSFTSVRETYRTRELVNIIRSKLPPSCGNKNFSGKVMLHNKTKNSCGIYLRCQERAHQTNHVCNFKVFFRLDMDDNVYKLYERSENTSFLCTCPPGYTSPIKEDQSKHTEVVNEVTRADKKNSSIESKDQIPDPVFVKDTDKKTYLKNAASSKSNVPKRTVIKPKPVPVVEPPKPVTPLRVSSRRKEQSKVESRSSSSNSRRVEKETVTDDEDTETSPELSRKVPLDFEKLFDIIQFSASKTAGHGIVREMCNEAIKETGVDKAFTYKLGMGRSGGSFTADSVYVRCCKKQGFSEKCELRALFKRDKKTDIWSLSRNTSHVNFLCHCDNYLTTELAIERASKKSKQGSSSMLRKSSSGMNLVKINYKRSSEDLETSVSSIDEVPVKRQKVVKPKEEDSRVGYLEDSFNNFDFSLSKKDSFNEDTLKRMITKNLKEFSINRKFTITYSYQPKVLEKLIIHLHMDDEDSNDVESRFGNQCKISVFCYRDIKTMKKMKVLTSSVDTNFECSCKTCMKYKMQSSEYLKKVDQSEVNLNKNLILPKNFHGKSNETDDCVDFSCHKCAEVAIFRLTAEKALDSKMNALFNRFD